MKKSVCTCAIILLVLTGCNVQTGKTPITSQQGGQPPVVSTVVPSEPPVSLTEVNFITGTTGFGITAGGIFHSSDAGQSWQEVYHTDGVQLLHLFFQGAQTGFVTAVQTCSPTTNCVSKPLLLMTVDGAKTWQQISPQLPADARELWYRHSMVFPSPQTGYAVLGFPVEGGRGDPRWAVLETEMLVTKDGGQTWDLSQLPPGDQATGGISFPSPDHGFITALIGHDYGVLATTDGGQSWRVAFKGGGTPLYAVQFLSEQDGYAAGGWTSKFNLSPRQLVLVTHDGGATWTEIYNHDELHGAPIVALQFSSPSVGWALTGMENLGASLSHPQPLLFTQDGGKNWTETKELGLNLDSVGESAWILQREGSEHGAVTLRHTTDGGLSWTLIQPK